MMSFQLGRPSVLVALGATLGLGAAFTDFLEVEVGLAGEVDMDDNNVESTIQSKHIL